MLLGTSAAARALHVSESTVRNYARRGLLPAIRLSSGIHAFDAADVEAVRAIRRDVRDKALR
jgi:DNA-binding transcriptional MerR regulator